MDSFVADKLTEWRLSELIENFRERSSEEHQEKMVKNRGANLESFKSFRNNCSKKTIQATKSKHAATNQIHQDFWLTCDVFDLAGYIMAKDSAHIDGFICSETIAEKPWERKERPSENTRKKKNERSQSREHRLKEEGVS
ncbi:hypothetical protein DPX16_0016 [Anabarilius grahami]|uniref:Uncharacterized protein n=1 Tax=Anabarilius grahami TaxID=495550 RepID=A0A3N0YW82_ANAGA|nr:hypothetical protein DPX16_0016 [Anabarilius grahami]